MRASRFAMVLLGLVVLAVAPCLAATVTTDPNKGGGNQAASLGTKTDPRLAQLVTYEGGYKRLHYAIEEISAKTGVTIRCGTNNQDWQVRDMPLVIAAQKMPLGKLLGMIAGACSLELISETIASDTGGSEKLYRLSLSSRARKAQEDAITGKHRADIEWQGRLWDALVENAGVPDSDFAATGDYAQSGRCLGRILKELGPDAKAKVLSGQKIELSTRDFPKPDLLRDYSRASAERFAKTFPSSQNPAVSSNANECSLSIAPNDDPATGNFGISARCPVTVGDMMMAPSLPLDLAARQVWQSTKNHDEPAAVNARPRYELPDRMPEDLTLLSSKSDADPAPAFMREKVSLDLPKDGEVTYADAICALARATGMTIIAEDYIDHKRPAQTVWRSSNGGNTVVTTFQRSSGGGKVPPEVEEMLKKAGAPRPSASAGAKVVEPTSPLSGIGKDSTVGDVIRALNKSAFGMPNFQWYFSEKNRVLVARPQDWMRKHSSLMPEAILADLKSKGNGSGIQLDDLTKFSAYSQAQLNEWIYTSKDLGYITMSIPSAPSKAVWALYEKLSTADKAAAKSEAGLPLAKLDPEQVSGLLKSGVESDRTIRVFGGSDEMVQKLKDQTARETAILTDPDAVAALTLRILKVPAQTRMVPMSLSGKLTAAPGNAPGGDTYLPELRGEYKGEPVHLTLDALYPCFPIYSPEREAELQKKPAK